MFYEVAVKYNKLDQKGFNRRVTEKFLIRDAVSFTDAEKQIIEELTPFQYEEMDVVQIQRSRIKDCFNRSTGCGERIYIADIEFVTLEEKSGEEKRTGMSVCMFALTLADAKRVLDDSLRGSISDWETVKIRKSKFVDLIDN